MYVQSGRVCLQPRIDVLVSFRSRADLHVRMILLLLLTVRRLSVLEDLSRDQKGFRKLVRASCLSSLCFFLFCFSFVFFCFKTFTVFTFLSYFWFFFPTFFFPGLSCFIFCHSLGLVVHSKFLLCGRCFICLVGNSVLSSCFLSKLISSVLFPVSSLTSPVVCLLVCCYFFSHVAVQTLSLHRGE